MRKLLTFALTLAVSGIATLPVSALAAGLPRYSSVVDASDSQFTVSVRKLGETRYVTCELPAPVECGDAEEKQEPIWGSLQGTPYRNEAGTLQVTARQNGSGSVIFTAYEPDGTDWKKVREWSAVGGATRVMVFGNGQGFAAFMANGTVVRYGVGSAEPLSRSTYSASGSAMTISATGRYLAFYKPATASTKVRSYHVADLTTGKEVSWSEPVSYWDLVSEDNRVFSFATDDSKLVLRSDRDGWQRPYLVNLSAGLPATLSPTLVFSRGYAVPDFVFIDANRIAMVANREGATDWDLFTLNVSTLGIAKVADSVSYGAPLRRFGSYVSFAKATPGGVSATLYNVKSGSVTGIESLADVGLTPGDSLPAAKAVKNVPGAGGYSVWEPSTRPAGTPIVLWLHGGPYRQISSAGYHPFSSYGNLDWVVEQVRLSGAVVAKLDYPGSYGYGRSYAESLTGKVGVSDVAAVKSAMASLRATYGASAPVYLIGNSYGGYLAQKSLVELGSSVSGIYSISGVTDWESLIAPNPNGIFGVQFGGAPSDANRSLYQQAKLILKVGSVGSQKVYLAHGDADTSVPHSQTTLLDQLLKIEGKNVKTTIYRGEDHVFMKPQSIADLCKQAIALIGKSASGRCAL